MNIFRAHSVAVSEATRWKLAQIAHARNERESAAGRSGPGGTKECADSVAEEVLADWLRTAYPGLAALWDERQAQERKAVELILNHYE